MSNLVKSALKVFGIKSGSEPTVENIDLEEFLNQLPEWLSYDIHFEKEKKEGSAAHYEIKGEEAEDFLGRNSNMLEALSHISMRLLRKNAGVSNSPIKDGGEPKNFRVTFDSSGFRERKILELKALGEKMQAKVIEAGGKPAYLPALSPSERKIVHTHIAELGECTSESIGKGTFKRIRIKLVEGSKHRKARPPSDNQRSGRGNGDGRRNERGGSRGGRGGGGRGGSQRRNNETPSFPSDNQPSGLSFVNDPYGMSSKKKPSKEVNGNVAVPDVVEEEIDDSIGNKMKPGEDRFDPKG